MGVRILIRVIFLDSRASGFCSFCAFLDFILPELSFLWETSVKLVFTQLLGRDRKMTIVGCDCRNIRLFVRTTIKCWYQIDNVHGDIMCLGLSNNEKPSAGDSCMGCIITNCTRGHSVFMSGNIMPKCCLAVYLFLAKAEHARFPTTTEINARN